MRIIAPETADTDASAADVDATTQTATRASVRDDRLGQHFKRRLGLLAL
jgi:hypothetical protein